MIVSGLLHSTRRETELCGGATTNDLERAGTWTPQKRTSIKQTHSLSNPQQLTITQEHSHVGGPDHDTGQFAVASIRGWWRAEGCRLYPRAKRLLITADGGGSNGYRHRLWKLELQH